MQFLKNEKIWFSISGALILLTIIAIIFTKTTTGSFLKYGIDFTGGTLIELNLENKAKTKEDLTQSLQNFTEFTPTVQSANKGVFIIKMKSLTNEDHTKIIADLKTKLGNLEETRFITIGPSIGETLKVKAFLTIGIALLAIVFYIAFAFREIPKALSAWKFGFSAIIALIHDVVITIGLFAVLGLITNTEIDALFITAILTVMGFSVHDTIVVFDRLRENSRFARPTETFADIGEKSIQQTLARSINTSLSVLFPLIALYFFGAESIKNFVLVLIVGITVGTYSSICLATPILVRWQGANRSNLKN